MLRTNYNRLKFLSLIFAASFTQYALCPLKIHVIDSKKDVNRFFVVNFVNLVNEFVVKQATGFTKNVQSVWKNALTTLNLDDINKAIAAGIQAEAMAYQIASASDTKTTAIYLAGVSCDTAKDNYDRIVNARIHAFADSVADARAKGATDGIADAISCFIADAIVEFVAKVLADASSISFDNVITPVVALRSRTEDSRYIDIVLERQKAIAEVLRAKEAEPVAATLSRGMPQK